MLDLQKWRPYGPWDLLSGSKIRKAGRNPDLLRFWGGNPSRYTGLPSIPLPYWDELAKRLGIEQIETRRTLYFTKYLGPTLVK